MIRVLVVDDERDIEQLFNMRFRKEIRDGLLEFHFSFSGEDALENMGNREPGDVVLILSDINMPGMNGLDLLKILKEKYPELPVFMITAYNDEEKYEKAKRYGAEEFIAKPIDFPALKNAMTDVLNKRKNDA